AQAFMSLEDMFPGRVFLGVGSGEALNETPLGIDWPQPGEKLERFSAGLEAITRLWDGDTVNMDAGWFRLKEAKLYTRTRTRPKLYVSAFGPQAARIAGRFGDGLWTLGDPDSAPEIIDAYHAACSEYGREAGPVLLHTGFAWAEARSEVIDGARKWKPTQLPEAYREDLSDPAEMVRMADERMSDEQFATEGFIISADTDEHVERIRELEAIGADVVSLQLIGGADPLGSIRTYGESVLPALRGARV
ncbi:MAG TPA: LLM class flavin-dependent oxidoreductase, partial [Solirubrobacteraceae bacterium]|nr:LLM class flavin-dependent oxidoreductase [Solirubrobacteraceae bacterium]